MVVATRSGPVLSPDSITYLSAAERLHHLDGLVDFTGEPLTIFPPVFPTLLALGGRSLWWASIVGAGCAAATAWLFTELLLARVRWMVAIGGAMLLVLSQAVIRIESTVWSEAPYYAISLALITVVSRRDLTIRRAATAGLLAGLGFLTRYAGAGLVLTGIVVIAAAGHDRRQRIRATGAYLAASVAVGGGWIVRNLVATGEPLGPHFEGGTGESLRELADLPAHAIGLLVTDLDAVHDSTNPIGYLVMAALVAAAVIVILRKPLNLSDLAVATYGITSIVVPVTSHAFTGNHIESRVMSPTLIATVYFAVVLFDRLATHRAVLPVGAVAVALWSYHGIDAMIDFPDRLNGSAGNDQQFSPQLYDLVDDLPDDVNVLTNNPQRVWWNTGHFPTSFAYTRPTVGNSHFPLTPRATLHAACTETTYLAWFPGLGNAQGLQPDELRPDLSELVRLTSIQTVEGGELFRARPLDPTSCAPPP